ncbi:MAG: immune inhibitor A [Bacteroidetes bacterium]|nr:immune inhibitor A [Bacteroidota bacterium]
MKKILFLSIILFIGFSSFSQTEKYSKAKIYADSKGLQKLGSLGIPIEGIVKKNVFLISDFSTSELNLAKANGFNYEILIDDVQAFYKERNNSTQQKNILNVKCFSEFNYPTPANFSLGTMGGFYTLTQLYDALDSMKSKYPNLITAKQAISATQTIEGRNQYFVKISDNPNTNEPEPQVFYNALTHAREGAGMQSMIFYMWYLLENYNSNLDIKNLVDNTEMYFVPCVNPDGYAYNELTDPTGGGMFRKNRKDNGDGSFGIDINRNYGFNWGYDDTGSSPNGWDETYRGVSAFSEIETQNMRDFCNSHQFKLAINNHTYGNDFLYPWGYIGSFYTPDSAVFKEFGSMMSRQNNFLNGTPNETVGYIVNGGADDWMYGEQISKPKIMSFTPESGDGNDGFWPQTNRILDICNLNMYQNLQAAFLVGKYARVTDKSKSHFTQINSYEKFEVKRFGLENTPNFTVSISPLTSNIASVGPAKVFSNMNLLQAISDSISISFVPTILVGDEIKFIISVNNGIFSLSDTISKHFGLPTNLLVDNCNNTNNWIPNLWGVTNSSFQSSPSSISDSPIGNYNDFDYNEIILTSNVSLVGVTSANLSFYTKWEIEKFYDYVQVQASINNGATWFPLCGKYSRSSSTFQAFGEPIYDGNQTSWVKEEIDLADFIGNQIKLKFVLVSDGQTNFDGFYFDDVNIETYTLNNSIENINLNQDVNVFPNPANSNLNIEYNYLEKNKEFQVSIINSFGQTIFTETVDNNTKSTNVDVSKWAKGVYLILLKSGDAKIITKKVTII